MRAGPGAIPSPCDALTATFATATTGMADRQLPERGGASLFHPRRRRHLGHGAARFRFPPPAAGGTSFPPASLGAERHPAHREPEPDRSQHPLSLRPRTGVSPGCCAPPAWGAGRGPTFSNAITAGWSRPLTERRWHRLYATADEARPGRAWAPSPHRPERRLPHHHAGVGGGDLGQQDGGARLCRPERRRGAHLDGGGRSSRALAVTLSPGAAPYPGLSLPSLGSGPPPGGGTGSGTCWA